MGNGQQLLDLNKEGIIKLFQSSGLNKIQAISIYNEIKALDVTYPPPKKVESKMKVSVQQDEEGVILEIGSDNNSTPHYSHDMFAKQTQSQKKQKKIVTKTIKECSEQDIANWCSNHKHSKILLHAF